MFHAFSSRAVDAVRGTSHTPAMTEPWKPSTDPLGEALHFLRMSGSFYCLSEFTAPWGLDLLPMQLGDVPRTEANIDAIARDLGYAPSTPIDVGVPAFVEWFRAYHQA